MQDSNKKHRNQEGNVSLRASGVQSFTFGLISLPRTLSHRRAPVLGGFLATESPSSSKPLSSSAGLLSLILSGMSRSQLQNAATDGTTSRTRIIDHWSLHLGKSRRIVTKLSVLSSRLGTDESRTLRVRVGTKPGRPASVLFYCPDGFGGLAPAENPLLPSLLACSRLRLRGALHGGLVSEVGSSETDWSLRWTSDGQSLLSGPATVWAF